MAMLTTAYGGHKQDLLEEVRGHQGVAQGDSVVHLDQVARVVLQEDWGHQEVEAHLTTLLVVGTDGQTIHHHQTRNLSLCVAAVQDPDYPSVL